MVEQASPSRRSSGLAAVLRARPLTAFFVLAYAVTWALWAPVVVLGLPVFSPTRFAPNWYAWPGVAIGVTGVAVLMTAVTSGRPGLARLGRRLVCWRVGLRWWAVAVLLIPISEIVVTALVGSPDALRALTPAALAAYPLAWISRVWFGPMFEETGWRGFALPRLQDRYGPARGTLVLGLLWSGWHVFLYAPTWFVGGAGTGVVGVVVFTVTTTAMSFLFTWLSNRTDGSLLLMIVLHASVDGTATYVQVLAARGIVSADTAGTVLLTGLGLACVVGAATVLVTTRGRLGHGWYRERSERLDVGGPVPS